MLSRTPVPQSAARKIQEMITSGVLAPGQKMPSQREFSQTLGLSRASLREALLTLETLGMLRTEPGRGTFVTELGLPASRHMARWPYAGVYQLANVYETRLMLESTIVGLSAAVMDAAQHDALDAATDVMASSWAEGDLLANVEADMEFHGNIAAACPNTMLADFYHFVRGQLTQTQMQPIPVTEPERMKASINEHRRIIAALRSHDAAAATVSMREHIQNTAACAGITLATEL
ncbi:FCD domain-containing protein [Mesorhizobium sp. NBSH29]|uniref:FadR/GntR family transcriptional regulator n=1 Tax=Mesorhizobium sp. NBSH29 TaxID=2654249 RepID=UPI0018968461|nr:FadR/GntR family transcriptional regulator [Mesorhizobium sp. NBSH29]QPC88351.1 FCD domain-containing protein [Mesorhizobium sp. NBSH29]